MLKNKRLVSCNCSIADLSVAVKKIGGEIIFVEPPLIRESIQYLVNLEYQEQCDEFPSVIIFNKISQRNDAPPKYKPGLNVDDYIKALKEWELA